MWSTWKLHLEGCTLPCLLGNVGNGQPSPGWQPLAQIPGTSLLSQDGQLPGCVFASRGSFAGFGILLFLFFLLEMVFLFIEETKGLIAMNFRLLAQDSSFKLS